ncbi:unnamed protein product [Rotaria sp. Silwood2]|nr:unnamed protein product [Rotaria sp. Silwood2]CAF3198154.1 unnamed protein product [Rotaria sp. Silwood2]CAF3361101.1 unnamed protein product [Rotaria sp. Silwood2]CAF4492535.1 unnamed protein product [Rotaria sp. Silwood2]CAF4545412.1 unnamed protein product [Rotaria sp. Silwood2]
MKSIIITTSSCTPHLLPNTRPHNLGHSLTVKTIPTKRPFNAFPTCTTTTQNQSAFRSKIESSMQALSKESTTVKYDNDQRHIKTKQVIIAVLTL